MSNQSGAFHEWHLPASQAETFDALVEAVKSKMVLEGADDFARTVRFTAPLSALSWGFTCTAQVLRDGEGSIVRITSMGKVSRSAAVGASKFEKQMQSLLGEISRILKAKRAASSAVTSNGAKLNSSTSPGSQQAVSVEPQTSNFCSNCGTKYSKQAAFCSTCGNSRSSSEFGNREEQSQLVVDESISFTVEEQTFDSVEISNDQYMDWDYKRKSKTPAVLLAVFLGQWTWLYTYKKDAWKFWTGLGIWVLGQILILAFYGAGIPLTFGVWLWAVIDVSAKPSIYYEQFFRTKSPSSN